jgi:hypothetical protein
MKLYKETTEWDTPNHTYLLDDSKQYAYGYSIDGTEPLFMFKKPIRFDIRGRKFEFVSFYDGAPKQEVRNIVSVQVDGSKGVDYTVILEDDAASCTCQGFQFRGSCRHIPLAREALLYL